MAKTRRKSTLLKPSKRLLILIPIVALAGASLWYVFLRSDEASIKPPITQTEDDSSINLKPATEDEIKEGEDRKLQQFNSTTPPVDSSPNQSDTISSSVKISNLHQDSSTKDVVVQTELTGTGWEQCTLNATKASQTVTKTAKAIYQSSYSSCLGFAIQSEDFPSSGSWSFSLTALKTDGGTLTSSIKTINVIK